MTAGTLKRIFKVCGLVFIAIVALMLTAGLLEWKMSIKLPDVFLGIVVLPLFFGSIIGMVCVGIMYLRYEDRWARYIVDADPALQTLLEERIAQIPLHNARAFALSGRFWLWVLTERPMPDWWSPPKKPSKGSSVSRDLLDGTAGQP